MDSDWKEGHEETNSGDLHNAHKITWFVGGGEWWSVQGGWPWGDTAACAAPGRENVDSGSEMARQHSWACCHLAVGTPPIMLQMTYWGGVEYDQKWRKHAQSKKLAPHSNRCAACRWPVST